MTWIKGFWGYVVSALSKVAETSGVYVVTGWVSKVSMPGAPTWLKTPLGWVGKGLLALWKSFWAVWGNPMTYPIIAAVAFAMFLVGHHDGSRPVRGAEAAKYAAERERDSASRSAKKLADDLAAAKSRIAELEKQPEKTAVSDPAAGQVQRTHKARAKKAAPVKVMGSPWGWPW